MTTLLVFLFSMGSTLPFRQNNKKSRPISGSFDDTSKIQRALEKNTPVVLDVPGTRKFSPPNREQPAGIIWYISRPKPLWLCALIFR